MRNVGLPDSYFWSLSLLLRRFGFGRYECCDLSPPLGRHWLAFDAQQKGCRRIALADNVAGNRGIQCLRERHQRIDQVIFDTQSVARFVFWMLEIRNFARFPRFGLVANRFV